MIYPKTGSLLDDIEQAIKEAAWSRLPDRYLEAYQGKTVDWCITVAAMLRMDGIPVVDGAAVNVKTGVIVHVPNPLVMKAYATAKGKL